MRRRKTGDIIIRSDGTSRYLFMYVDQDECNASVGHSHEHVLIGLSHNTVYRKHLRRIVYTSDMHEDNHYHTIDTGINLLDQFTEEDIDRIAKEVTGDE